MKLILQDPILNAAEMITSKLPIGEMTQCEAHLLVEILETLAGELRSEWEDEPVIQWRN